MILKPLQENYFNNMFKIVSDSNLIAYKMNKYEIIIYWSEVDDAFIAEVPEHQGKLMYA
jgi:hypothetical protein